MFGSDILDVAIGLVLVYLLLSLLAAAVREAIEAATKSRATRLTDGIRELLGGAGSGALVERLYDHPLLFALYSGSYRDAVSKKWMSVVPSCGLPSYVPARNFAIALMDTIVRGNAPEPYAAQQVGPTLTAANLRAALSRVGDSHVRRAILTALDTANDDLAAAQLEIQAWFDSAMDRVSGGYKRRTHGYLLLIGLALTIAVNVNTITIAHHLARNKAARELLVQRAAAVTTPAAGAAPTAATIAERQAALASLELPIGWRDGVPRLGSGAAPHGMWNDWIGQILGLLLTAFALTFGAPFWFDVLNKFMVIRSTVKPHEKSPEEGSEDRRSPAQRLPAAETQPPPTAAPHPPAPPRAPHPVAPPVGAAMFEPRQWAHDADDEGIL